MKDGRKVKNITGLSKGNRKGIAKMDLSLTIKVEK
jgi:hypothetical protein